MSVLSAMDRAQVDQLIGSRREFQGLPGGFYREPSVFRAEMELIWRQGWLFAGHTCQIPKPGDFVTFEVDTDPVLVARGDDGQIRAFHNLCRHRGTLLCDAPHGHAKRFVCPYHQWTFDTDGALLACRGMGEHFDKSQWGLLPIACEELEGFVFVSLAPHPTPFSQARDALTDLLRPQGLARAKVAYIVDYQVRANWKIVWENNRECYHCNANHPQYIKANYDHFNRDDTTPQIQAKMDAALHSSHNKWQSQGLAASHRSTGMTCFPDAENDIWYSANRTVLADGYVSETMDGRPVAPLMGDYTDVDVGTLRFRTMPNMWNHSSCDHAVSTRLLPAGPETTKIQVTWLVDQNAVEGRDYHRETLLPFWQLTSEQDWELCERAQRGMVSSGFQPGPLSEFKEYNLDAFFRWYLKLLQD